ncbi:helix-turn-helix domain-containing protein [Amycolatopsis pithecellobii]|uniref:Helix-turn-helix domain-containing protein n=1 Tax=Amycolatopsis pithecellobii TaxID=664692 RepID=A0A6N7YUW6_9PSEU|nr:helix-turn-helix transcriptional regulator [Amycolatopsis pithecellobii]MTD55732.1 helix-turn-helix domain-containing protein [Amycolatopsis pithecellobii]
MPDESPLLLDQLKQVLGKRLGSARGDAGLSLDDLAERTGLDRTTIHRIEQGDATAKLDTLVFLFHALRIDPAPIMRELVDLVHTRRDPGRRP